MTLPPELQTLIDQIDACEREAGAVIDGLDDDSVNARAPDASAGTWSGTRAAILPRVLLPSSPYNGASGSSPMPTLSSTMRMKRSGAGAANQPS